MLLFHRTAVEETQDTLVELIDYCYRKLIWLSNEGKKLTEEHDPKKILETKPVEVTSLDLICLLGFAKTDAADSVL